MSTETSIHQKSINNAIAAYLMVFISGAFLFNKDNEHINNNFVKSHTKVAFIIHLLFLVNYIIFINQAFLTEFSILGYQINYIIASTLFLVLFVGLLYGVHQASKAQVFLIGELMNLGKREAIIDVNGDNKLDEKDKLTLILSYIPFLGYIVNGMYYKNPNVQNIIFLNLIASVIISLIYIFGYTNIALLLVLFYTIFAVFSSINIISSNTLISVNLRFAFTPEEKIVIWKTLIKYLKNYFGKGDFIALTTLRELENTKRKEEEIKNTLLLQEKKKPRIPHILLYIPVVNLFTLGFYKSQYRFHVINGFIISLLFIALLICNYFYILNTKFHILLLFPIFFGIGYIQSRPAYKMPFIYEIFEIFVSVKNIFSTTKNTIKEKQAETHEVHMKVGEKDQNETKKTDT